MGLCQLLPEQRQIEGVHYAIGVEVGGLLLVSGERGGVQEVVLEKDSIGGGEGVVGVEIAGELHFNPNTVTACSTIWVTTRCNHTIDTGL